MADGLDRPIRECEFQVLHHPIDGISPSNQKLQLPEMKQKGRNLDIDSSYCRRYKRISIRAHKPAVSSAPEEGSGMMFTSSPRGLPCPESLFPTWN